MAGTRCVCAHGRMLDVYDIDVRLWEEQREAATSEYATEMVEWERDHPRPLLKDYFQLQGVV